MRSTERLTDEELLDPTAAELLGGDGQDDTQEDPIAATLKRAGVSNLPDTPTSAVIEAVLRALAEELSGADSLRRAVVRNAAVDFLRGRGVATPAALLDAALGDAPGPDKPLNGQALTLVDPEKWPMPVDGAVLLDELVGVFERYVVLPAGAAIAVALWVLHTFLIDVLCVSPILVISSPEKRCGKSTLLDILRFLCRRAMGTANISGPALFRVVEQAIPTLLIDEADTFLAAHEELRGIIDAGHTRGSNVIRTVGENFEVRTFRTFCPKAIAAIGALHGTIEDRAVIIRMRRRASGETVHRLRRDRVETDLQPLRQRCMRWAADSATEIRDADPALPEALNDRAMDNWRSLIAIADTAGRGWPEGARHAALKLAGAELAEDAGIRVQLLADVREVFGQAIDRLPSEQLVERLVRLEGRPWAEWKHGKPMTANGLARQLKPFEIHSKTIRIGDATPKGYERADFTDAWARYLPPAVPGFQSATAPQPAPAAVGTPFSQAQQHGECCASTTAETNNRIKACGGVALAGEGSPADEERF